MGQVEIIGVGKMGVGETLRCFHDMKKTRVDKMGVDEMGSRRSGMTPWCRPTASTSHFVYSHFVYSHFIYSHFVYSCFFS